MNLTSRERIMRIFQNKEIDRPALKLWGATTNSNMLHPDYKPVWELAMNTTDIFELVFPSFDVFCSRYSESPVTEETRKTNNPLWNESHTTYHTPEGDLHSIDMISTIGDPSYTVEHLIKEPDDFRKAFSLPFVIPEFPKEKYLGKSANLGERGIVMHGVPNAGQMLHSMIGSENLAYFSVDCRDLMIEMIQMLSERIREYTQTVLSSGIIAPFYWVGPEVFIPPLMSPNDFEEFIFNNDKLLCDDIHNGGFYTWMHCHGKVAKFIERFIDMGIDVVNPLEPPNNGDIILDEIIRKFGNKIGWEGNIEIQDIIQADTEKLKELIYDCVQAGSKSSRFILCPSAGYMEISSPPAQYIENLMTYLKYGLECVENCRF